MRETEKFRTERLVARPWQIEDLPLAMELWGDPAVTGSLIPAANSPMPKSERSSAPRSSGRGPVEAYPRWGPASVLIHIDGQRECEIDERLYRGPHCGDKSASVL
jgi:hypothetical protein